VIRRPGQTIAQLHAERSPLYQAYSDTVVDTTGQNPEQVVRSILDFFPLKK
jgi:shikimate kinase